MTQLLREAFEIASRLPEDRQDQIAQMLLAVISEEADHPRRTEEQIEQVKSEMHEPLES